MDKILKQVQDDRADLNNSVIGNSFGFAELKVQHLFTNMDKTLKQVQGDDVCLFNSVVGNSFGFAELKVQHISSV